MLSFRSAEGSEVGAHRIELLVIGIVAFICSILVLGIRGVVKWRLFGICDAVLLLGYVSAVFTILRTPFSLTSACRSSPSPDTAASSQHGAMDLAGQ